MNLFPNILTTSARPFCHCCSSGHHCDSPVSIYLSYNSQNELHCLPHGLINKWVGTFYLNPGSCDIQLTSTRDIIWVIRGYRTSFPSVLILLDKITKNWKNIQKYFHISLLFHEGGCFDMLRIIQFNTVICAVLRMFGLTLMYILAYVRVLRQGPSH